MTYKLKNQCFVVIKIFIFFIFIFFIPFVTVRGASIYYGVANAIANIRSGPGTGYKSLGLTSLGNSFDLDSKEVAKDEGGCSFGWYKVNHQGSIGYVCGEYLDVYERSNGGDTGIATTACEKDLEKKGFPSSYWKGLCSLKNNHSNWNFEAQKTGVDFNAAVSAESSCGTNRINTNLSYYKNLNCSNADASGYWTVSSGVVAYYLDPRNFFNDSNIFMFLSQYYNGKVSEDIYRNSIIKILGSSNYLYQQILDLPTFILNGGKEKGVDPISIASRIKQELGDGKASSGAYKGQLQSALSGNYYDRFGLLNGWNLNNYYNFFNIGAYDSCSNMTECALVYAYRNGWGGNQYTQFEARQIAINGGTNFIKTKYIDRGQDTVYLHKFNVNPVNSSNRYVNQYMSNIQAPQSESSLIYSAYKGIGKLDSSFVFYIPVYENMPKSTSLPTSESNKDYVGDDISVDNGNDNSNGEEEKLQVSNIIAAIGYKKNDNYLSGIALGTNVADIISKIKSYNASVEVKNNSGINVTSGVIGTGYQIKISALDTVSLTTIIYGDTSGDGKINALDLLQIQKNILGTSTLSQAKKIAADVSHDNKVNALDLLKVQKNILGSGTIAQN